jgi:hypothetical protein
VPGIVAARDAGAPGPAFTLVVRIRKLHLSNTQGGARENQCLRGSEGPTFERGFLTVIETGTAVARFCATREKLRIGLDPTDRDESTAAPFIVSRVLLSCMFHFRPTLGTKVYETSNRFASTGCPTVSRTGNIQTSGLGVNRLCR